MFADYLARIAAGHRAKADYADSEAERLHWQCEAERFELLAAFARTDPVEAHAMYRPTRAYQPEA